MAAPVSLDLLISHVRASAPDEPLAQLSEAARLKDDVGEVTDALLGHFVDQARRGGCSWSQIGEALGVSKQAAQQKHAYPKPFTGERFTDRARAAVAAASDAAHRLGHTYVGTEHLLLGLLSQPEGLAGKVLAEHGITTETVDAHVLALVGRGPGGEESMVLPHTPRVVKVLTATLTVALELGHNYIGTEHLLLALYREPDSIGARFVAGNGLSEDVARARIVELCTRIAAAKGL
jgi:hypothetical protein